MSTRVTLQMPELAAKILRDPRRLAHLNALLARAGLPKVERVDVYPVEESLSGSAASALEVGQRIKLVSAMIDDPCPVPAGATGTIQSVYVGGDWVQYHIAWDPPNQTRTLMAICPPDVLKVIPNTETHDARRKHDAGPDSGGY